MEAVLTNPIIIIGVVVMIAGLCVAGYFGIKLAKRKAARKGNKIK